MAGMRKVAYIHSEEFIAQCGRLPKYKKRVSDRALSYLPEFP